MESTWRHSQNMILKSVKNQANCSLRTNILSSVFCFTQCYAEAPSLGFKTKRAISLRLPLEVSFSIKPSFCSSSQLSPVTETLNG